MENRNPGVDGVESGIEMIKGVNEYVDRNEKLVELAKDSAGYSHFCMRCALEGVEPWTPGMYETYMGCVEDKDGSFDVWKALSE